METLDGSIINTALPSIAGGFNTTALGVSSSVTAYLLAMAVFVPAAGWCGERFGARNLFAWAIGIFTLASLLCGIAPTLWMLVAARFLQGTAAAFMSPVGRFVVLSETPKERIIEAISTITWPGLIAPVLGPVLGGIIVTHTSWRWIFLLNLPLGLAGIWLVLRYIPHRPPNKTTPFDLPGFCLTALALATSIEGLSRLGDLSVSLGVPLSLLVMGAFFCILSVWHARRIPSPLLDLRAIRVPTFALSVLTVGFISRIAINASPFLLPLMVQIGFGFSAQRAGLMVLIYMGGNLLMKSLTTATLRRFGFRNVLVVNSVLCALSLFGCGLLHPENSLGLMAGILLVAGMTRSMNFTSVNTLAFADISAEQRSGASALATMLTQVSMSMGVAVAALALNLSQNLRGMNGPATLAQVDFRNAWFAIAALMTLAAIGALRLHPHAGAAISNKSYAKPHRMSSKTVL